MESSTILPSETNFSRLSYGRNRVRKKQPRTNPNYVNIEIKSNDGSLRSTYIRIHDVQKSQTSTLSSSSSSSSTSSAKNLLSEPDSLVSNSHFHSQPFLIENQEFAASSDTIHASGPTTPTKKTSQRSKTNEEKNELIMQQPIDFYSNDEPQTLTNKSAQMMKQFVACNDGKQEISHL